MKIYAPNIHLFAFQLYKSSNIDLTQSQLDRHLIWTNADEIVRTTLNKNLRLYQRLINVDTEPNNPRLDLLKDPIQDNYAVTFDGQISLDHQNQDLLIKGFAYPLRIYDSYCLWLNLRRPEKENNIETDDVDIAIFSKLNPNNCLTVKDNPLFLGQTLLITGWLTGAKDKKIGSSVGVMLNFKLKLGICL